MSDYETAVKAALAEAGYKPGPFNHSDVCPLRRLVPTVRVLDEHHDYEAATRAMNKATDLAEPLRTSDHCPAEVTNPSATRPERAELACHTHDCPLAPAAEQVAS